MPAEGFIAQMKELLGEDAGHFLASLEEEPVTGVRRNLRKTGVMPPWWDESDPVPWCPSGFYLADRPDFTLTPQSHSGLYYVQDPSSMVYESVVRHAVGHLLDTCADRPLRVFDSCAAPGGKTTAVINALPDNAQIVANEFVPARANILRENLAKWGFPNVIITNSDTKNFTPFKGVFDIVIADVPCSGEGMMRKSNDAVSQWSPSLIAQCAGLQREILANVIDTLRPGGVLIYSTCTYNREEDEEQVLWACEEFSLKPLSIEMFEGMGVPGGIGADVPALRFMPHRTRGEGLFVAMLQKSENYPQTPHKSKKSKSALRDSHNSVPKQIAAEIAGWFTIPVCVELHGNNVVAVPEALLPLLNGVRDVANVKSAGVEVGELKGGKIVPSASLALCTALKSDSFPKVEVTKDEALSFLRGETLTLSADSPKGNVIITYGSLPLGFVKNLGNRANNPYPQPWRIKKK